MSLIQQFLSRIRVFACEANGQELKNWLLVENNVPDIYRNLGLELRQTHPPNTDSLEKTVDQLLPEEDNVPDGRGSPWPGFNSFIKDYLEYWRDVNFSDLVQLHTRLSDLLISCANALANPTYGVMLLQTSMSLSESLSKLVMGITRNPELLAQAEAAKSTGGGADESSERKSIVELAADIIQKFFTSCLTDRSSGRWETPKGKKVAVYLFANLTLKLLFTCDKSPLAAQMFTNLSTSGPALQLYPASQRVTFLYYLGRFNFDHAHYFRAHLCFEEAYRQCHVAALAHKRKILTYWIPCNMLFGRFPSQGLLGKQEAVGFGEIFVPICQAIRLGDFVRFYAAINSPLAKDFLWGKGFYLPFLYRLKNLVWRSFTRKTFILTWKGPSATIAPSLSFDDLLVAARFVQRQLEASSQSGNGLLMPSEGLIFGNKVPDMDDVESVVAGLLYAGLLNGFIARQQRKFVVEGTKKHGGVAVRAGWPGVCGAVMERFREQRNEALEALDAGEAVEAPGEENDVPGWVRNY
ncbi:protein CSN12 [Podospora fimiseda]|uniref:Protein CSN12 n=1 Tax=Podospora fimiseda TaxID=252190 RepID=A0AAN7H3N0_9PEZI|nr:protein CSN12 [Podospora fimiseda]